MYDVQALGKTTRKVVFFRRLWDTGILENMSDSYYTGLIVSAWWRNWLARSTVNQHIERL